MKLLLLTFIFMFSPALLLAQESMPELAEVPANVAAFISSVDPMILAFISKFPFVTKILIFIGGLRAIFKPLTSFTWAIVNATPSKSDDEKFKTITSSKIYGLFAFFLDYAASVKAKNPKKTKV